jgi:hypothetical protein
MPYAQLCYALRQEKQVVAWDHAPWCSWVRRHAQSPNFVYTQEVGSSRLSPPTNFPFQDNAWDNSKPAGGGKLIRGRWPKRTACDEWCTSLLSG